MRASGAWDCSRKKAGSGHNDFTPVYPYEVVKRALAPNAAAPSIADAEYDDNGVEVVVRWPELT
jgi:hypothetical protein